MEQKKSINELRDHIDEIDEKLVSLLLDRIFTAQEIGAYKRANNHTNIHQPQREKKIYQNVLQLTAKFLQKNESIRSLSNDILVGIFKEIISISTIAQKEISVYYLGPPASFSHIALKKYFGGAAIGQDESSIQNVFRKLEASNPEEMRFAIVPRDNLIEGPVGATLDALLKSKLFIYAECYLPIIHNLVGYKHSQKKSEDLQNIKRLYTIKIAYHQCYNWVHQNLNCPQLEIVEMTSTAAAAQAVAQNKDGVAIASQQAAELYKLDIIQENIQNNANNLTRFFILSHKEAAKSPEDKTSIVFTLPDQPGTLSKILLFFDKNKINLSCIESRTSRRSFGEYNFFIDFHGHKTDSKVQKTLGLISKHTSFLKILGSYPRTDMK